jgi:hypothetical protein
MELAKKRYLLTDDGRVVEPQDAKGRTTLLIAEGSELTGEIAEKVRKYEESRKSEPHALPLEDLPKAAPVAPSTPPASKTAPAGKTGLSIDNTARDEMTKK